MVVPNRKNEMIKNIMKNQEREKNKLVKKMEQKEISQEDHEERIKKLKELGILK